MTNKHFFPACLVAALVGGNTFATSINFNFYVDDYATVLIDGVQVGSYNNPASAGNIIFTADLTPGSHTFAIDYKNQAGTNFLSLSQQYAGDPGLSLIPLTSFQSLNATAQVVNGLRADYYSLAGSFLFTLYGEGPISHGALSFSSEIYEGQPGLWAGTFGPSALFEERLSGVLLVSSAPEPSTAMLGALGLLSFLTCRARNLFRSRAAFHR